MKKLWITWALALAAAAIVASPVQAAQALRQLVDVEGVRENQLLGYGLVVGLNGSGDSTQVKFAGQSVANLLKQFGVKLPEKTEAKSRNAAAVMVSASFPAGYRRGQSIDLTVSSLGDAKSLRGGTLLLTELHAADGEVYALAQGNLVVTGLNAQGQSGSSVTVNTPTTGRVPNGGSIEREIATDFDSRPDVVLNLKRPGFQTATQIVEALNRRFGDGVATTRDGTSVSVRAPADATQRVAFVAQLQAMPIEAAAALPRVIFNSRTGTVVIADGVKVRPAAVSHGSLKVVISESPQVSQPNAFSQGRTQTVPQSQLRVDQGDGRMFRWPAGTSLQAIVDMVNSIGANPDDLMAILQALDQAGAIEGELQVI
ncbi:flagellar basal body P-ring protein FlgI [Mitsuaria sp. GD03876]|uniref:flagellar basal body P-ring protein FlgI n=1 Tax=Mitsuaria sp. GD03876 TaxID=2975399 RepID=UPI0024472542|nr:flagellar basal body P-ring protein FlgI [Mitsuaria sp. GD03876]MDH0867910.1 flagellar basal body P-ring protein FlgI [Mitsuaria sp. GD03876]